MTDQNVFAVLSDAEFEFWPTSEAKPVPMDTTAPNHAHVRHANPLFGLIERMIDGLDDVIWLTV